MQSMEFESGQPVQFLAGAFDQASKRAEKKKKGKIRSVPNQENISRFTESTKAIQREVDTRVDALDKLFGQKGHWDTIISRLSELLDPYRNFMENLKSNSVIPKDVRMGALPSQLDIAHLDLLYETLLHSLQLRATLNESVEDITWTLVNDMSLDHLARTFERQTRNAEFGVEYYRKIHSSTQEINKALAAVEAKNFAPILEKAIDEIAANSNYIASKKDWDRILLTAPGLWSSKQLEEARALEKAQNKVATLEEQVRQLQYQFKQLSEINDPNFELSEANITEAKSADMKLLQRRESEYLKEIERLAGELRDQGLNDEVDQDLFDSQIDVSVLRLSALLNRALGEIKRKDLEHIEREGAIEKLRHELSEYEKLLRIYESKGPDQLHNAIINDIEKTVSRNVATKAQEMGINFTVRIIEHLNLDREKVLSAISPQRAPEEQIVDIIVYEMEHLRSQNRQLEFKNAELINASQGTGTAFGSNTGINLQESLKELEERYAALDASFTTLARTLESTEKRLAGYKAESEKIPELEGEISALENKLRTAESMFSTRDEQVKLNDEELRQTYSRLTEIEKELEKAKENAKNPDEKEKELEEAKKKLDEATSALAAKETSFAEANGEIQKLKAKNLRFKQELAGSKKKGIELTNANDTERTKIVQLESDLAALRLSSGIDMNSLREQLDQADERHREEMERLNKSIIEKENKIAELERIKKETVEIRTNPTSMAAGPQGGSDDRVKELEVQVEELKKEVEEERKRSTYWLNASNLAYNEMALERYEKERRELDNKLKETLTDEERAGVEKELIEIKEGINGIKDLIQYYTEENQGGEPVKREFPGASPDLLAKVAALEAELESLKKGATGGTKDAEIEELTKKLAEEQEKFKKEQEKHEKIRQGFKDTSDNQYEVIRTQLAQIEKLKEVADKVQELEDQLTKAAAEAQELEEAKEAMEKLKAELEDQKKRVESLEKEAKDYVNQTAIDMTAFAEKVDEKVDELQKELDAANQELTKQKDESTKQLDDLRAEAEKLRLSLGGVPVPASTKNEIAALKKQLEDIKKERDEKVAEVARRQVAEKQLEKDIEDIKREKASLETEVAMRQVIKEDLEKQLEELGKSKDKTYTDMRTKFFDMIRSAELERDDFKKKSEAAEARLVALQTAPVSTSAAVSAPAVSATSTKIDGLKRKISTIQQDLDNAILHRDIIASERDAFERDVIKLEGEKNALEGDLRKSGAEVTTLKREKATLEAEVARLTATATGGSTSTPDAEVTKLTREKATLEAEVIRVEEEKKKIGDEVVKLTKENEDLKSEKTVTGAMTGIISSLKNSLPFGKSPAPTPAPTPAVTVAPATPPPAGEIQKLTDAVTDLTTRLNDATHRITQLTDDINVLTADKTAADTTIIKLRSALDDPNSAHAAENKVATALEVERDTAYTRNNELNEALIDPASIYKVRNTVAAKLTLDIAALTANLTTVTAERDAVNTALTVSTGGIDPLNTVATRLNTALTVSTGGIDPLNTVAVHLDNEVTRLTALITAPAGGGAAPTATALTTALQNENLNLKLERDGLLLNKTANEKQISDLKAELKKTQYDLLDAHGAVIFMDEALGALERENQSIYSMNIVLVDTAAHTATAPAPAAPPPLFGTIHSPTADAIITKLKAESLKSTTAMSAFISKVKAAVLPAAVAAVIPFQGVAYSYFKDDYENNSKQLEMLAKAWKTVRDELELKVNEVNALTAAATAAAAAKTAVDKQLMVANNEITNYILKVNNLGLELIDRDTKIVRLGNEITTRDTTITTLTTELGVKRGEVANKDTDIADLKAQIGACEAQRKALQQEKATTALWLIEAKTRVRAYEAGGVLVGPAPAATRNVSTTRFFATWLAIMQS